MTTKELIKTYPRKRKELPEEYKKIYVQHYEENRKGKTKVSYLSGKMEYNVPYRVDKFKSSFPEIRQVKVPIPSEMDR